MSLSAEHLVLARLGLATSGLASLHLLEDAFLLLLPLLFGLGVLLAPLCVKFALFAQLLESLLVLFPLLLLFVGEDALRRRLRSLGLI